jgi:hypothetical protein
MYNAENLLGFGLEGYKEVSLKFLVNDLFFLDITQNIYYVFQ